MSHINPLKNKLRDCRLHIDYVKSIPPSVERDMVLTLLIETFNNLSDTLEAEIAKLLWN